MFEGQWMPVDLHASMWWTPSTFWFLTNCREQGTSLSPVKWEGECAHQPCSLGWAGQFSALKSYLFIWRFGNERMKGFGKMPFAVTSDTSILCWSLLLCIGSELSPRGSSALYTCWLVHPRTPCVVRGAAHGLWSQQTLFRCTPPSHHTARSVTLSP